MKTYRKILIATDGSKIASKAVDQGLTLAKATKASVVVLTVKEPMVPPPDIAMSPSGQFDEYDKASTAQAEKIMRGIQVKAKKIGVKCKTIYKDIGFPSDVIIDMAKKERCDLIVMASHGRRGLTRLLLGSTAHSVITYSKVPVLVCR